MKTLLYATNLVLVMLVTGVFWGTWFTLTRSIELFPPDHFINIGKTIIHNVAWPMRILMPATLLMQLWLCLVSFRSRPSFYFLMASLLLMIITLLITVLVEVPIDNEIKTWSTETLPDNWTGLRETWRKYHAYRTATSILGFIFLSIGILKNTPKKPRH